MLYDRHYVSLAVPKETSIKTELGHCRVNRQTRGFLLVIPGMRRIRVTKKRLYPQDRKKELWGSVKRQ